MILLSKDDMGLLAEFNNITKAVAKDVIVDSPNNRVIFIVKIGEMGLGIGKGGVNIQRLSKLLNGKRVELVEEAISVEDLISKALYPAKATLQKMDNERKIAYIQIEAEKKGYAIGSKGVTINKARMLVKRYFGIENIIVT